MNNANYTLATQLLKNRNYTDSEIYNILYKPSNSINSPYLLHNAKAAAKLLSTFCDNPNSMIYIYGDYDVDGITSTYVLLSALQTITKGKVQAILPNRIDGYGLNMSMCEHIANNQIDNENILVVTVDNGITCVAQIAYLKAHNIKALVLDHHEAKANVPDCLIVDPHGHDADESNYHLCGCGVVFKVAQILLAMYDNYTMMSYTPFVALGILADMVDMTEENMALVKYGIDIMKSSDKTKSLGLNALLEYCGLNDKIYPIDLKFKIIPMLNACGRMNQTATAFHLLSYQCVDDIDNIVNSVVKLNDERKKLSKEANDLINKNIQSKETSYYQDKAFGITLYEKFSGICGIAASQAIEKCNAPIAFALSYIDNNMYTGSIRVNDRYDNLDLQEVLQQSLDMKHIEYFGGHKSAAGFTIAMVNEYSQEYQAFVDDINNYLKYKLEHGGFSTIDNSDAITIGNTYDLEISLKDFNEEFYASYAFLPLKDEPVFCLNNAKCISHHVSKNNPNNIEYKFKINNCYQDIWIWNEPNKYIDNKTVSLYGSIMPDFRNRSRYTMNIQKIDVEID